MKVQINKYHGNYNISRKSGTYKNIAVHYVGAGTSAPGSAKNNCIYFSGGNRNASAHYFIDDGGIWEYADPDQYYTWHIGDGGGAYGYYNNDTIGIEVCIDGDNPFTKTEIEYLKELVSYLMSKYGIPASRVIRHYDASRKQCPYYYAKRQNEWESLRAYITGGSASTPTYEEKPANTNQQSGQIAVDGFWGNETTRKLQTVLGTTIDGIISGQANSDMRAVNYGGLQYSTWSIGSGGSQCIRKLQSIVGTTVDGYFGKNTCKALQRYLGTTVDGYVSNPSEMVKALQRKLNTGKF